MPQSLTRLPKEAEIGIGNWSVTIQDHKVVGDDGLTLKMIWIVNSPFAYRKTLSEFENWGVSFEAAVEWCAHELENNVKLVLNIIRRMMFLEAKTNLDKCNVDDVILEFSKSGITGRIATLYVDKIRSCENWEELYDTLQQSSKFTKEMNDRIKEEVKLQCRRV